MLPMRDGRTNERRRTREDRATQPMDAGWLSFAKSRKKKAKSKKQKAHHLLPVALVLLAVKRKRADSPLSYCLLALSFLSPDSQNDDDDHANDDNDDGNDGNDKGS